MSYLLHDLKCLGSDYKLVCFSFETKAASDPDAADNKGAGFSVVRSGAGEFTITLDSAFVELVSAHATLQENAADDKFAQVGPVSVANRTIVVSLWDVSGAGAEDLAENINNRVNVMLLIR